MDLPFLPFSCKVRARCFRFLSPLFMPRRRVHSSRQALGPVPFSFPSVSPCPSGSLALSMFQRLPFRERFLPCPLSASGFTGVLLPSRVAVAFCRLLFLLTSPLEAFFTLRFIEESLFSLSVRSGPGISNPSVHLSIEPVENDSWKLLIILLFFTD